MRSNRTFRPPVTERLRWLRSEVCVESDFLSGAALVAVDPAEPGNSRSVVGARSWAAL